MTGWGNTKRRLVVRNVNHDEVKCYVEFGFDVIRYDGWNRVTKGCDKTFVIRSGHCDGEAIDLFDLQKWFDENREWIDGLREEIE